MATPLGVADHGGGIDAACRRWGGARADWLDLSTGINPQAYPLPDLPPTDWTALPDSAAMQALLAAARRFWLVPDCAAILAAPGTSAIIARLPGLLPPGRVDIPGPTYNEHARAFAAQGWEVVAGGTDARVLVQPNNPDGRLWREGDVDRPFTIVDESFADVAPEASLIAQAARPGVVVLKGLGKFWGLAGLRLGFATGDPPLIARLADLLGPWSVSGPALTIGTAALSDPAWAEATRLRLRQDAARLDQLVTGHGARPVGGTTLFRLYDLPDATRWRDGLARQRILGRVFPYSRTWLRLGFPGTETGWSRLSDALEALA